MLRLKPSIGIDGTVEPSLLDFLQLQFPDVQRITHKGIKKHICDMKLYLLFLTSLKFLL